MKTVIQTVLLIRPVEALGSFCLNPCEITFLCEHFLHLQYSLKISLGVITVGNIGNVRTKQNIHHMLMRVEAFQCGNVTYYIF